MTDLAEANPGRTPGKNMQLEHGITSLSLDADASAGPAIRLDGFTLSLVGEGRAQLRTDVTLRDGKKVVVGTSTVQDRGLVVVVSAHMIR